MRTWFGVNTVQRCLSLWLHKHIGENSAQCVGLMTKEKRMKQHHVCPLCYHGEQYQGIIGVVTITNVALHLD